MQSVLCSHHVVMTMAEGELEREIQVHLAALGPSPDVRGYLSIHCQVPSRSPATASRGAVGVTAPRAREGIGWTFCSLREI